MHNTTIDVLIIGAGPSGCIAASYLHLQGFNICIIEKNKFPRFVIGESLLPRCMDHLEEVKLLAAVKKEKFQVKKGARFLKNGAICNFDFSKKHSPGWDWTWQVPRSDFDYALTQELEKKGVSILFEHEVTDIVFDESGKSVTTYKNHDKKEQQIQARFIIDASGYGRVLPRMLNLEKPSSIPNHSSIFTHVNDINRPEGEEGTLITFDVIEQEVWLWVIPFSNGTTSIGFVGKNEWIDSFQGSPSEKIRAMIKYSKHYQSRFLEAPLLFEPKQIRNYAKSVRKLYGKGYAITGNSAEFLDPVFSSGVTFATESALKAAKLATKEFQGKIVNWQEEYANYMKEGVDVFATYVKEWYTGNLQKIFFHQPENKKVKRQVCAVLAGYVWDKSNPFVRNADRLVKTVADYIDIEIASQKEK